MRFFVLQTNAKIMTLLLSVSVKGPPGKQKQQDIYNYLGKFKIYGGRSGIG